MVSAEVKIEKERSGIRMKDLVGAIAQQYVRMDCPFYYLNPYQKIQEADYYEKYVKEIIRGEGNVSVKNPWTYIRWNNIPKKHITMGWKIHVSAIYKNHIEILKRVSDFCYWKKIDFKFATNEMQFLFLNSKEINRVSAGKFMVLYPNQNEFGEVIEELSYKLKEYVGPYILSDRPYKGSKCVFYRYGEFTPLIQIDEYGMSQTWVVTKENDIVQDQRVPFFQIVDKAVEDKWYRLDGNTESRLLNKYAIKKVVNFTSQGGIYLAEESGKKYIVKEARAHAALDIRGMEGSKRLAQEFLMLKELAEYEIVPQAVEFFYDNGSFFLIEEYIDGIFLNKLPFEYSQYFNPLNKNENIDYMVLMDKIIRGLLDVLKKIQDKNIIIGDISASNIVWTKQGKIMFCDFETAHKASSNENGKEVSMWTLGFECMDREHTEKQREMYKIARVILFCIFPYNTLLVANKNKAEEIVGLLLKNEEIPRNIIKLIYNMLYFKYKDIDEAIRDYKNKKLIHINNVNSRDPNLDVVNDNIIDTIEKYLMNSENELGCDPNAFLTNRYSFAYGIFGMLYAVSNWNNKNQNRIRNIVHVIFEQMLYEQNQLPAGLYIGTSGIAYVLLRMGRFKEAKHIYEIAIQKELQMYDIAYGLAGRIQVSLAFYSTLHEDKYLHYARKDAEVLLRSAESDVGMLYWKDLENDIYSGLTRGSSGIALTLLQMYVITKESIYLNAGKRALDFELNRLTSSNHNLLIIPPSKEYSEVRMMSPYIHRGVSGLGCVLVRYYLVTKETKYLETVKNIEKSINAKYIMFPGYLRGCTGILSFLADCKFYLKMDFLDEKIRYYHSILNLFYANINGHSGIVGDELMRLSNDLFTGAAGTLLLEKRLIDNKRENLFLPLDDVFENYA